MISSTFTTFDMMMMNHSQPSFSYVYGLLPTLMFFQIYWTTPSSRQVALWMSSNITSTLTSTTNNMYIKGSMLTLTPVFLSIIMLNLYGAAPYTITLTSHLFITLSMGGPAWFTLFIISTMISIKLMIAHLLPENSPTFIASFLALVETLSSYIRPITLSFRLSANISAGHVILGMMTSGATFTLFSAAYLVALPIITSTGYSMFEMAICLVQAFVFTLLATMYSNDYLAVKKMYDI